MRAIKAGILYFLIVFGAGFMLGPIRVLWLVPRVGVRVAELIESPIMLVVIFLAARWITGRFAATASKFQNLGIGLIALGLLLATEMALTSVLWGVSFAEYMRGRDPVANAAFAVMLLVFALMPLLVRSGTVTQKRQ